MTRTAPRSIDQNTRTAARRARRRRSALVQDALYDAEEYLRAELAAHPGKAEADVLELIASTYGAPDEVAAAYRDTEAKVKVAMAPRRARARRPPAAACAASSACIPTLAPGRRCCS